MTTLDLSLLQQQEAEAQGKFRDSYEFGDPCPEEPVAFSWKKLGIEFPLTLITGAAAIIQAALRTSHSFMNLAEKAGMTGLMLWVDGASAMIGVEGFVAVIGFVKAKSDGRERLEAGEFSGKAWKETMGLLIALTISVAAGLGQSIAGAKNPSEGLSTFVDTFLLFALGIGASLLAYFAGEIAGVMIVRAEKMYGDEQTTWKKDLFEWNARFTDAWNSSDYIKFLRADIKGLTTVARRGYRSNGSNGVRSLGNERTNSPIPKVSAVAMKIRAYLNEHSTDDFVPGPSEIARECDVSKGYASRIRGEWIDVTEHQLREAEDIPTPETIEE